MSAAWDRFIFGQDAHTAPVLHRVETYLLASASSREVQNAHLQTVAVWRQTTQRYAEILLAPLPGSRFVGTCLWIPLFRQPPKKSCTCVGFWRVGGDDGGWIAWRGHGPLVRDAYAILDPQPQDHTVRLCLGGSIQNAIKTKANVWSPQDAIPHLQLRDGLRLDVQHQSNTQVEIDLAGVS